MYQLIVLAVIGAIIGWITNVLAIKMLFRPVNPIVIPIINFKIQGLIPKRRSEIAKSIGEAVENEILTIEDILAKLITDENKNEIINITKTQILNKVDEKMPILVPSPLKRMLLDYLEEQIEREGIMVMEKAIEDFIKNPIQNIKIGKMVEEKIDEFELDKIEQLILQISARELKHIEVLGGVLGFLIGIIQGIIVMYM